MSDLTPMGVICINKQEGITSHTVVNMVRRLYNTKQVGHTGTLDPLATGVLPVMVGRAVKASEYLTAEDKSYIAEMKLGKTTDSGDITGKVLTETSLLPSFEAVRKTVLSFVGDIKQTPPMYSALKVNGQKLVDLARKGVEVERAPRDIHINSIEVELIDEADGKYTLKVDCSKGTYIRTLITDIGNTLGCGGVMTALKRTKSGSFVLEKSYTTEELEYMTYEERIGLLLPIESLFSELTEIKLPLFFERLAKNGLEIYLKKIGLSNDIPEGTRYRLAGEKGFFALGEVMTFSEGKAVKPIKQFIL